MAPAKKLNLNIEIDVLTAGSTAEIVNRILEFLLYQRNQIPFVYNTYNYYVDAATQHLDQNASTVQNFHLQRQREQAKETKDSISAMRELIIKSFDLNVVKCLRFLFGSTTFTAREAYTIHIPVESISRKHCHRQHRIPHARLNEALLTLLTNEDLYTIFSSNLCPTNLYLELEMLHDTVSFSNENATVKVLPKDVCQLPPSCKDIHLYLLHRQPFDFDTKSLQCCQELKIFEDLMRLDLNTDQEQENNTSTEINVAPAWWEADVIVRGFKEKLIRGVSIWSNRS